MKQNREVLQLDNKKIIFEVGGLALQTNGSVTASCGGTVVLATVVASRYQTDLDYFPLQVECVERLYAGGRIKGSRWVKREGKPSEESILNARLVDRAIRPLFPPEFKNEVQVVITILSVDHESDPVDIAILAAIAALHISDIPWNGPISVLRIGAKDSAFFVNPLEQEREFSDLDLVVATSKDGIVMLEGGSNQISEDKLVDAVKFAQDKGETVIKFLEKLRHDYGKKKIEFAPVVADESFRKQVDKLAGAKIKKLVDKILSKVGNEKEISEEAASNLNQIIEETKVELADEFKGSLVKGEVDNLFKKKLRKEILAGKRPGGRKTDELRPLGIEVGLLPRTHGSAVFQRGLTKVLSVTTLGSPSLKQLIESPEGEETKRYMHHYFMPPYSVGETGRFGWPGRREIGHGALAERALLPVIPSEEKFPYAIRVVSEVVSSNGSTSMASVCGSTLSLMDAGVPITSPVAGISVGMVSEGKEYVLLTDIAGIEDFNGDMDFKVAGTDKGITALQVDVKTSGLSLKIITEALEKAKIARKKILAEMKKVIAQPRGKISRYAPKVVVLHISPGKIGELIGPGGKTIRRLIDETECDIDVEDDGTVSITGLKEEMVDRAAREINALTREVVLGEEFEGTVKRLQPFGAFIEFLPGKEGLVHVSRLGNGFIRHPQDVLKIGQKIQVRVREIDEMGRINLELVKSYSR